MGKNCDDFPAFTTCKFRRTLRLKWHNGCGGKDVMQLNVERATVGRGQPPHLWENRVLLNLDPHNTMKG